jgi:hypothetical protein
MIGRAVAAACASAAVALLAPVAHGYLKLGTEVNGRLVAIEWTALPVEYFVANRDVSGVTAFQLQDATARAFGEWTGVDGVALDARFDGFTNADPFEDDFLSVIGFQSRPDLDRTLGATTFVIDSMTGAILESDIFLNAEFNWSVASNGEPDRYDVESIMVHELGHLFGLGHSALGETELVSAGRRRVLGAEAVMFPIAYPAGNTLDRELKPDDRAGILDLYGTPESDRRLGAISGRVRMNGVGVFGAHVTAFNTATGELFGTFVLGAQGNFAVASLPQGLYVVRVEPLDDADIDSFFNEDTDVNIDFRPAYYPQLVAVPAGGAAGSIDITVRPR